MSSAGAVQVCLLYFSTCLLYADLFGVDSLVVDGGYDYKRVGGKGIHWSSSGCCHVSPPAFVVYEGMRLYGYVYKKRG